MDTCPHLVQVVLVDGDPLEAAALGRLHVHGADVVLAVVMAPPPQAAEGQTPGLWGGEPGSGPLRGGGAAQQGGLLP